MAKGKNCRISNCKNILRGNGTICGKHRWRLKKFNSYDLPNHIGEPNYYIKIEYPIGIISICDKHGNLEKNQVYIRYYKGKESSYYCKECILSINIKNKYKGLNGLDCYEKLLKEQNYVCAICKQKNTTTRNGKIKRYAIDHCHITNKVRGLLCGFCNAALGYYKDSIELHESAIIYLKKHQ